MAPKGASMAIYLTADLHLGHSSILHLAGRPFGSVKEMDEAIIANYNAIVRPNDIVYLLGDVTFRIPLSQAEALIRRLNGRKVLLRGNHDKTYDPALFEDVRDFDSIKVNGVWISMMHYPMLEWPHSRHGAIQAHGHQHNKPGHNEVNREAGIRRYDVGVDANRFFPVNAEALVTFFNGTTA